MQLCENMHFKCAILSKHASRSFGKHAFPNTPVNEQDYHKKRHIYEREYISSRRVRTDFFSFLQNDDAHTLYHTIGFLKLPKRQSIQVLIGPPRAINARAVALALLRDGIIQVINAGQEQ